MNVELISVVKDWLETKGYESYIDTTENYIVYLNDDCEEIIFCKTNETALQKIIEDNNMTEKEIIV